LAKRRQNVANSRKRPQGKRPLITLLIVAVLIVSAFFLLEKLKRSVPPPLPEQPVPVERHKIAVRKGGVAVEQQPYTSAKAPPPPRHPRKRAAGPGTVAIIVDDMGSSIGEVNELMAIRLPLTFSIIPGLAKSKGVAQAAHTGGYQVMIHIPMEPQGYPRQRMEQSGLLLAQSDGEIQKRLNGFLQAVPYARGANNHMGSRFTEDRAKMGTVLGFLKGKGLFFIDSRTTPRSVGNSLAREMGLETASRNVFIDNVQDVGAIKEQLEQLAAMARHKGGAIGICHPHKTTIQALSTTMPELQRSGITFVYAADLVR
jgi:polysaccharide deacetylase 2 family uncharacterized protein YibQ